MNKFIIGDKVMCLTTWGARVPGTIVTMGRYDNGNYYMVEVEIPGNTTKYAGLVFSEKELEPILVVPKKRFAESPYS